MMAGMKCLAAGLALAAALLCPPAVAQSGAPWQSVPRIVVVGAAGDARQVWVREAVLFWNAQLRELGSGFALGEISTSAQAVPEAALQAMRPTEFASDVARLFPLSDNDRRILLQLYPPGWVAQVTR